MTTQPAISSYSTVLSGNTTVCTVERWNTKFQLKSSRMFLFTLVWRVGWVGKFQNASYRLLFVGWICHLEKSALGGHFLSLLSRDFLSVQRREQTCSTLCCVSALQSGSFWSASYNPLITNTNLESVHSLAARVKIIHEMHDLSVFCLSLIASDVLVELFAVIWLLLLMMIRFFSWRLLVCRPHTVHPKKRKECLGPRTGHECYYTRLSTYKLKLCVVSA